VSGGLRSKIGQDHIILMHIHILGPTLAYRGSQTNLKISHGGPIICSTLDFLYKSCEKAFRLWKVFIHTEHFSSDISFIFRSSDGRIKSFVIWNCSDVQTAEENDPPDFPPFVLVVFSW